MRCEKGAELAKKCRQVLSRTAAAWCVGSVVLAGCGSTTEPVRDAASRVSAQLEPAGARIVGPDEFAAVMAESGRVTINVHVPYEGDIAGTDLSIPFDQITELDDLLPQQRSMPLALYCRTGRMSAIAADSLTSLGYLDVVDLRGGMKAWQDSGRSLIRQ